MKVLLVGDIVGEPGRKILSSHLDRLVVDEGIDAVIANAENAAGGFGITPKIVEELFDLGVHVITTGNHAFDKKEIMGTFDKEPRLLRPANYPAGVPGRGTSVIQLPGKPPVAVLHLMGRVFMPMTDCPFQTARREVDRLRRETSIIVVDIHGEATSEKSALAWYLDGQVSAVIGTHTHVQTADETILPQGTAFLTDTGMTGPTHSVIGVKKEMVIEKFLTQTPKRFEMAGGPCVLQGAIVDIDGATGKAAAIKRVQIHGSGF